MFTRASQGDLGLTHREDGYVTQRQRSSLHSHSQETPRISGIHWKQGERHESSLPPRLRRVPADIFISDFWASGTVRPLVSVDLSHPVCRGLLWLSKKLIQ